MPACLTSWILLAFREKRQVTTNCGLSRRVYFEMNVSATLVQSLRRRCVAEFVERLAMFGGNRGLRIQGTTRTMFKFETNRRRP